MQPVCEHATMKSLSQDKFKEMHNAKYKTIFDIHTAS